MSHLHTDSIRFEWVKMEIQMMRQGDKANVIGGYKKVEGEMESILADWVIAATNAALAMPLH